MYPKLRHNFVVTVLEDSSAFQFHIGQWVTRVRFRYCSMANHEVICFPADMLVKGIGAISVKVFSEV